MATAKWYGSPGKFFSSEDQVLCSGSLKIAPCSGTLFQLQAFYYGIFILLAEELFWKKKKTPSDILENKVYLGIAFQNNCITLK